MIPRPGVIKRFTESVDTPLVVVVAPAGFGKTTAVRQWADTDDRPFEWVNLGPVDDDPVQLIRHLAATVHLTEPLDPQILRVLTGGGRAIDTDLLPALGHTIENREPTVLVLDDAHHLTSEVALQVVQGLLPYLPPGAQMVALCRHAPALHLARRQLEGSAIEISADDLVMSAGEAATLFEAAGLKLGDAEVDALVEQTEGWPAGLGLATLALRGRSVLEDLPVLQGRDRPVVDYLMEEVLADIDEPTRTFMLRSSVLDRMSVPLLDDLLGGDSAASMLRRIDDMDNPFLVHLDGHDEWYRYHHLFGDALRFALEHERPDEVYPLRSRASHVLEASGDADGAVRLAVAASEHDWAAEVVLQHAFGLIGDGRTAVLHQWLQLLGSDMVERSPCAAIASAWLGISTGDAERIARSIRAVEGMEWDGPLPDGSPSLAVAGAAVRSIVAAEGTDGVVRDTEIIRNGGGPRTNPWWGYATCLDGTVATLVGDNESGRALLTAGLPEVAHLPSFEAGFLGVLALLEVYEGDLVAAERHAHRAHRLCDVHNLEALTLVIPTYAGAALVAARLGRADESRRDAQVTRRLLVRLGGLSPRSALRGYVALAQAAVALGDFGDARALAREAADVRRRDPSCPYLNDQLEELERHLAGLPGSGSGPAFITAAELRILSYLPTQLSLRGIAEAVYLSRNTVKTHVMAIYRKLGVSSRTEAVNAASQLGLIDIPGQRRTSIDPGEAGPLN